MHVFFCNRTLCNLNEKDLAVAERTAEYCNSTLCNLNIACYGTSSCT